AVASPALVFMATSTLMTECIFAALQMGTLLAAERWMRRERSATNPRYAVLIAFLAALTFLIRSFGIVLIAAIVICLARQRLFKPLVIFVVALAMFLTPWTIYKHQLDQRTNPAAQARLPGPYP